jgi:hypothetical protein
MRNTPGNIIQFPESTLLVDAVSILIHMEIVFDHVFYGLLDTELEPGFVYHLTNVGFECSFTQSMPSEAHGFVNVEIVDRNGPVDKVWASVGYDLLYPAGSSFYIKSQQVDIWLWGKQQFQVNGYLPFENYAYLACKLFLSRYRR